MEVSPSLSSAVTDSVLEDVKTWQARPLDAVYPIVHLDAIPMKMRSSGHVQNTAVYVALANNLEGQHELLGLWIGETEGAKFWPSVLTEHKNRGAQNILIAAAEATLDAFGTAWGDRFPTTTNSWWANWANLTSFFDYPPELRKVVMKKGGLPHARLGAEGHVHADDPGLDALKPAREELDRGPQPPRHRLRRPGAPVSKRPVTQDSAHSRQFETLARSSYRAVSRVLLKSV